MKNPPLTVQINLLSIRQLQYYLEYWEVLSESKRIQIYQETIEETKQTYERIKDLPDANF